MPEIRKAGRDRRMFTYTLCIFWWEDLTSAFLSTSVSY
jgi:hypothetical protein